MLPNGSQLQHTLNGWWSETFGGGAVRPVEPQRSPSHDATIRSRIGLPVSLHNAVTLLPRSATSVLQKKLRQAGFKGAVVEPLLKGDGGGFTVDYQDHEYKFWIEEDTMHTRNGRGIYHGTGLHKNDMVIHQNHRGRWRIDLVTSAGGNHVDVTERESGSSPNSGYSSAESAFTAALGIQRKRGLYGKTNVFVPDGDEYKLYEPEGAHLPSERNGRASAGEHRPAASAAGAQEDDYVLNVTDRDGRIGLFRIIRGGKWRGPLVPPSASIQVISGAAESDAQERGTRDAVVFEVVDGDGMRQGAHVLHGRWQVDMEPNGRRPSPAKISQDLEAAFYFNERKIADAEEELRRPGISAAYRQQMLDLIASSRSDMDYARRGLEPNGRATVADPTAARELSLYIENEAKLVGDPNSIGRSIDASLRRKVASGKYDSALAPKAWQYLIDEGAKRYTKEFGTSGDFIFNAATRRQVAEEFARAWELENAVPAVTIVASISDGMSRNAGGETTITADTLDDAIEQAEEWVRDGSYTSPDSDTVHVSLVIAQDGEVIDRRSVVADAVRER